MLKILIKKHLYFGKTANYLLLLILSLSLQKAVGQKNTLAELSWLGKNAPKISAGISWGVPFPMGTVSPNESFTIEGSDGNQVPVQFWPTAYWPDGSLKWGGFSLVAHPGIDQFQLKKGKIKKSDNFNQGVVVQEDVDKILVKTGLLECALSKESGKFISSIKVNNKIVSSGGYLVCYLQRGQINEFGPQPDIVKYTSKIKKMSVEQNGPVRAVVKIEGTHRNEFGEEIFPFTVRLYFYQGLQTIKMVHSFIFDADHKQDFVRGLGIVFDVPFKEELHNRHIRFSGENNGIWDEPVKPLTGRYPLIDGGENVFQSQLEGKKIKNRDAFSKKQQFLIDNWASWNDFRLVQNSSDGFIVEKRTNDHSAYIHAGSGGRSSGLVFAGESTGGLTVCMKDFWQSYPSMLEVKNAKTNKAEIKAWLWSPEGQFMDMRHYDTLEWGHTLRASYEDVQPGFSTPFGIARTSEFTIFATESVPSIETLNALDELSNKPVLLTAKPEYLHSAKVFGLWSLPDTNTAEKKWIEKSLDKAIGYYKLEIEQRNWYGFWDYGDIMHSYDQKRHLWCYDIGGNAWDNTELMPNMWFWYSYLRSGRADIFRMAEAMTRHTGEVDVYHTGQFAGLGSRHNVRHWGCGAKEVRISQAALGRFYYYLTTDERTGDLMRASVELSNEAIGKLDPLRLILNKGQYPTHARIGPDWMALAGNWMTEWERTGDTIHRNKIITGINSFSRMPYGLYSGKGAAFGYDPQTFELFQIDSTDIGYSHLSILMGGPEVAYELSELLDNNNWDSLWLQFCRLYGAPKNMISKEFGMPVKLGDNAVWSARMPAYYAYITKEPEYAEKAWNQFLNLRRRSGNEPFKKELYDKKDSLEPIYEIPHISTNATAQWCLNAIELLEMIGEHIPEGHPIFKINKEY
jgi:hypothetical protein